MKIISLRSNLDDHGTMCCLVFHQKTKTIIFVERFFTPPIGKLISAIFRASFFCSVWTLLLDFAVLAQVSCNQEQNIFIYMKVISYMFFFEGKEVMMMFPSWWESTSSRLSSLSWFIP